MRHLLFALGLLSAVIATTAGSARAQDKLVVVELYTSQGCSSCPPADALLSKIAREYSDVIALALHVDYWDYIGWRDAFADPSHSRRQKDYARVARQRSVFTPQMVIGGRDHVVGYKPMDVANVIQKHRGVRDAVQVSARFAGNEVQVQLRPTGGRDKYRVTLVGYTDAQTVAIKRGENAGRTITYTNTVRQLVDMGAWDGRAVTTLRHRRPEGDRAVVLVQKAGMGPIVGAARVR